MRCGFRSDFSNKNPRRFLRIPAGFGKNFDLRLGDQLGALRMIFLGRHLVGLVTPRQFREPGFLGTGQRGRRRDNRRETRRSKSRTGFRRGLLPRGALPCRLRIGGGFSPSLFLDGRAGGGPLRLAAGLCLVRESSLVRRIRRDGLDRSHQLCRLFPGLLFRDFLAESLTHQLGLFVRSFWSLWRRHGGLSRSVGTRLVQFLDFLAHGLAQLFFVA